MTDLIGASLARPDALGKVTGATLYPADLVKASMLQLQVVFAHRPHARILAIDTAVALQYPGVVAVMTAQDVPHNVFGLIEQDQPVLCSDVVRFEGDKVALVIADSKQAAQVAAKLVAIEYENLPIVSDPQAALASDSALVHEQRGTNLLYHFPLRKGDAAQALAEADVVIEDTFTTTWQEHAFLQPEAGIAYVDERGRLILETAGQWLHEDRRQIAAMLQLPEEQVVVRYAAIGGAFGGREDLSMQHVLALAAWKLQRPVALVWSREESMIGHHKRHPVTIKCRWGGKRDGTMTAIEATVFADGGAYASTSAEVIKDIAFFVSGTYEIEHLTIDGYAVYTNNIPSGAFRGFGAPQGQFACEIMVTRLAQALQLNPDDVRRKNIYREGSLEPTKQALPVGVSALPVLERCIEEARARWHYGEPCVESASHLKRGIGLTSGIKNVGYSFGYPEKATATVEVYGQAELERAVVRVGATDVGQGTHLILQQIAAETLDLPIERVTMICTDSSEAPNAGSTSASRMTFMGGRAVKDAAQAARENWSYTDDYQAQATIEYRAPHTTAVDPVTHSATPHYCYGYAAQAVDVEVNILTGQVRVLGIISVHDVGKAINMQQVTGQIEGCLAQALGYALIENFQMHQGHVLTSYFSTYLLPTSLDMPTEIVPIVLELANPHGPFGARGMAEMPLVPFAPAVAAAIHAATGVWLSQLPMTPERVLTGLKKQLSVIHTSDVESLL
jgi:CO/xanthine dehydrogenase Mo-binding subunit